MKSPTIGTVRTYPGPVIPILYPGEQASAVVTPGDHEVTDWIVEPMPGWRGWWLRMRWRCWQRWRETA